MTHRIYPLFNNLNHLLHIPSKPSDFENATLLRNIGSGTLIVTFELLGALLGSNELAVRHFGTIKNNMVSSGEV
jgi:hypothetical protein